MAIDHSDGRRRRGDLARADILRHATQIASRDGLEHLTMGRLATDAGIAKGNIQVLFGNKEALQLATIDYGVVVFAREVVEPAMRKRTPLTRLATLIDGWYDYVEARRLPGGCLIHALSNEYRTRPGPIRDVVERLRIAARHGFVSLLNEAKAAGQIRPDVDAEQLAFELTAYQASANIAALMDDLDQFALARRTSRDRLRESRAR